jgi:pantoate--beta-alanine ligase
MQGQVRARLRGATANALINLGGAMGAIVVADTIESIRRFVAEARASHRRIGFVPTMGYLHEGHLSLVRRAAAESDIVVASIFVNPTQFNNPEDLKKYPRDIPRDLQLLESVGTAAVFLPTPEMIYGPGFQTWVNLNELPLPFEGAHRPGHFQGVATIVSILFNLVEADCAVFGEKDFQQLRIIERMVADLKFRVRIIRGELVRDPDGLAMSSRNVRLTPESRAVALGISRGLRGAVDLFGAGERRAKVLRERVAAELSGPLAEVDYISVADEATLLEVESVTTPARLLVAATIGGVRLIDNMALHSP